MKNVFTRVAITLVLFSSIILSCSSTTNTPSSPEAGYRYDDLPTELNESSAIAEYRAISKWSKLEITYYFVNGTGKLDGNIEHDLIRQAFDLWSAQTSLSLDRKSTRLNSSH